MLDDFPKYNNLLPHHKIVFDKLYNLLNELNPPKLDKDSINIELTHEDHVLNISFSHIENNDFSIQVQLDMDIAVIAFGDAHTHIDHDKDETFENWADSIITYVEKLITSVIEVHSIYKNNEFIRDWAFIIDKNGKRSYQGITSRFSLNAFNPFIKKELRVTTVSFF